MNHFIENTLFGICALMLVSFPLNYAYEAYQREQATERTHVAIEKFYQHLGA